MRALPNAPESPNIRALGQWLRERFPGAAGPPGTFKMTLQQIPSLTQFIDPSLLTTGQQYAQHGLELVFKDGALLDPVVDYTIDGQTITIVGNVNAGDRFVVFYPYRTGV